MEERLINALLRTDSYPEPTTAVQLLQTHVSYLFITDQYVYKIKKPVDFGFLNFSTIDRRRFYCNEEVRLNRRLSPDLYLGVVELRQTPDGASFTGNGPVLDYAVKMRRLPADRMLDRLLARGEVDEAQIRTIARTIAAFHLAAERGGEIAEYGRVTMLRQNWLENFQQIEQFFGTCLNERDCTIIREWAEQFLTQNRELFERRVAEGFIRDCDGDIHLENICLTDRVYIFDCIEFNYRFRYSDTAADIAFLLMDFDYHGHRDFSELFLEEYLHATGDRELPLLLDFYKTYRAFVRGKVACFRSHDPQIPAAETSADLRKCTRYFRLARGYVLRRRLPRTLFITCGLMGSGKSTIAQGLSWELGLPVITADLTRKRLAGLAPTDRSPAPYGEGIYSPEATSRTYTELLRQAEETLGRGESVLIDATFRTDDERQRFAELATRTESRFCILRTLCPEPEIRKRLQARLLDSQAVSDGREELLARHMSEFSPPTREEGELVEIDSTADTFAAIDEVLASLGLI